jgi:hypothetical protein
VVRQAAIKLATVNSVSGTVVTNTQKRTPEL